jgi:flagella basal body P-ring formation protein FlgA
MIRFFFLVLLPLVLVPASAQSAPILKSVVSISSDIVTLGDLVAGAGDKAGIAIFRAPDLGQTGQVATRDIVDAAAAQGLTGIQTGGLDTVAVSRVSRTVTLEEVQEPLKEALAATAMLDDPEALQVQIDPALAKIQIPVEADGAVRISDAVWLKDMDRFEANLVVRRIDGVDERIPLTGKAVETLPIVTAARQLTRGTVLTAADLQIQRTPKSSARNDILSDTKLVAGMEIRRAVREGQPIRAADLSEPVLVKNGASVSMILKSGALTLTATGQSLADGKMGGAIQVMNTQSKRVLQGVVTGPDQVTVQAPRTIVSVAK